MLNLDLGHRSTPRYCAKHHKLRRDEERCRARSRAFHGTTAKRGEFVNKRTCPVPMSNPHEIEQFRFTSCSSSYTYLFNRADTTTVPVHGMLIRREYMTSQHADHCDLRTAVAKACTRTAEGIKTNEQSNKARKMKCMGTLSHRLGSNVARVTGASQTPTNTSYTQEPEHVFQFLFITKKQ